MNEFLSLLNRFDELNAFEEPTDRDDTFPEDAEHLREALNQSLNLNLKLTVTQDAAFYGYLSSDGGKRPHLSVRLSKFGRLVTLRGIPEDYPPKALKDRIIRVIEETGFVYIPVEILMQKYDGKNIRLAKVTGKENPTWWDRYFDYI